MNRRSVSYENAKFDEDQPEYGSLLSDSEITHPYATTRRTGSKIPRPFDKQQNSTNFKSLNRNRKSNGMYSDAHARNYSAPGARSRRERQSISDFPSSRINAGRGNQNIIVIKIFFSKNLYLLEFSLFFNVSCCLNFKVHQRRQKRKPRSGKEKIRIHFKILECHWNDFNEYVNLIKCYLCVIVQNKW